MAVVARNAAFRKHCATEGSGYIQRKLAKALEDITVRHDGTVRNGNDEIIQTLFGDDGFSPDFCVSVRLTTQPLTAEEENRMYTFALSPEFSKDERQLILLELDKIKADRKYLSSALTDQQDVKLPLDLPRLMAAILAQVEADDSDPPLTVTDIIVLLNRLFYVCEDAVEKHTPHKRTDVYREFIKTREM